MGEPSDQIHAYTGGGYDPYSYSSDAAYQLAGHLPTQVYKVFDNNSLITDFVRTVGNKAYELKDHLGNVRVVVSDAKIIEDTDASNTLSSADNFLPEVRSAMSFYPFGQKMPGTEFYSGDKPRYDFNGKETDQESGLQDYGMRIYDGRIGKFLSVDPLAKSYAWNTPYAFAENDVIRSIDLDGLEKAYRYIDPSKSGYAAIIKVIPHKDLYPGQDHGPKGTGTLDFYYDNKVKKFGEGQYEKSYKDAHPIRAWLQEGDKRYEDKRGFVNLTNDIGTGIKIVGGLTAIVAPPLGAGVYEVGAAVSDAGDAYGVVLDIKEGENSKAEIGAVTLVLGGKASGAVSDLVEDEARKLGTKMTVDLILDKTKDALKEKVDDDNKKGNNSNNENK
jgi:RHS repeat-associated protein